MKRLWFVAIFCAVMINCTTRPPRTVSSSNDLNDVVKLFWEAQGQDCKLDLKPPSFGESDITQVEEYIKQLPMVPKRVEKGLNRNLRYGGTISYLLCFYDAGLVAYSFDNSTESNPTLICVKSAIKHGFGITGSVVNEDETESFHLLQERFGKQSETRRHRFIAEDGASRQLDLDEYVWELPWASVVYYLQPGAGPTAVTEYWDLDFVNKQKEHRRSDL